MNSTDFNKIAGAGLGALLIFLLLNFFSGQIYGTREAGEHHGEEVLAFALAVDTEAAGEEEEAPVDYAALVAAADPGAGESTFRACSACHKLEEGANAVGPHLHGVVGRDIASVEGFSFSDALMAAEGEWTLTHLSGFLENPKGWAPGTKMSYAGLSDPQDRVNLIAYLNQAGGSPIDLAEGLEPIAAVEDAGTAIPDPALSVGVGPGPGVTPPQAVEGSPQTGESAGIEAASEAAAVEGSAEAVAPEGGEAAGDDMPTPVVTEITPVDPTREGAELPTSPAAQTHMGDRTGEDIVQTPDPTPEAPVQQNPGTVGAPGQEAAPLSGAPEAADAEEDAATPATQEAPAERVEGEDAPPRTPPGQAPAAEQGTEAQVQGAEQLAAAPAEPEAAAGGGAFAGGDAAAGEKIFRRCAACHKLDEGVHGIGPSLHGVVGREVGGAEGYTYSDAMQAHGGVWSAQLLSDYLEKPQGVVPGTKMAFAGLKDEQDRIDVITFLNEADGSPEPLE